MLDIVQWYTIITSSMGAILTYIYVCICCELFAYDTLCCSLSAALEQERVDSETRVKEAVGAVAAEQKVRQYTVSPHNTGCALVSVLAK